MSNLMKRVEGFLKEMGLKYLVDGEALKLIFRAEERHIYVTIAEFQPGLLWVSSILDSFQGKPSYALLSKLLEIQDSTILGKFTLSKSKESEELTLVFEESYWTENELTSREFERVLGAVVQTSQEYGEILQALIQGIAAPEVDLEQ